RRRHTRLVSDWSSDVCSSDLIRLQIKKNLCYPGPSGAVVEAFTAEGFGDADGPGEQRFFFICSRIGCILTVRQVRLSGKGKFGGAGEGRVGGEGEESGGGGVI